MTLTSSQRRRSKGHGCGDHRARRRGDPRTGGTGTPGAGERIPLQHATPTPGEDSAARPAAAGTAPPALPRATRLRRIPALYLGLLAALLVLVLVSAAAGQMGITPAEVFGSIMRRIGIDVGPVSDHPNAESALWVVRFPRLTLAALAGASLAVGGVLMQGVFGNPLAEPGVIGVSAGAAAAAAASIALGLTFLGPSTLVFAAFVGGLIATMVAYVTARSGGRTEVVTLILTGVAVNAVAGAVIAFMTFIGDTQAREEIVFWQLGSLNGTRWPAVYWTLPLLLIGFALAMTKVRQLDLLALGERQARHVGVDVERLRMQVIVIVAVLTSAAVAFCGIIAFVGLVVPHLIRMVIGPGHAALLPASAIGGAVLLLAADLGARTLIPYADLPIGMLTALVGGPFFFWLIRRTRRGAGGWA